MYTHILILLIKVCQLLRKYICGVTRHKTFGFGLTVVNEVCRHKVFILGNTIVLFYWFLYDILCLMLRFFLLTGFW